MRPNKIPRMAEPSYRIPRSGMLKSSTTPNSAAAACYLESLASTNPGQRRSEGCKPAALGFRASHSRCRLGSCLRLSRSSLAFQRDWSVVASYWGLLVDLLLELLRRGVLSMRFRLLLQGLSIGTWNCSWKRARLHVALRRATHRCHRCNWSSNCGRRRRQRVTAGVRARRVACHTI